MSANEKSLFGLFKKKPTDTPIIIQEPSALILEENENLSVASTEEEQVKTYSYTSSWQKTADDEAEHATREDVINVHNVVGKLDEIFHSADEVGNTPEEENIPTCLSHFAADKFSQALVGEPDTFETSTQQPVPTEQSSSALRFSERLKYHVEARINQEASQLQLQHESAS